jgi:hypothetical protein
MIRKMDYTEPENQIFCRNRQKCSIDTNLDCDVCVLNDCIH